MTRRIEDIKAKNSHTSNGKSSINSDRIGNINAMLVNGYEKASFTGIPRIPSKEEFPTTRFVIIYEDKDNKYPTLPDDIKKKIIKKLGLDYEPKNTKWMSNFMLSTRLHKYGWTTLFYDGLQFNFDCRGRSISYGIEIDYKSGKILAVIGKKLSTEEIEKKCNGILFRLFGS